MALTLPIGPLKTCSWLEPVLRCEPSTYQPISRGLSHCAIGASLKLVLTPNMCFVILQFKLLLLLYYWSASAFPLLLFLTIVIVFPLASVYRLPIVIFNSQAGHLNNTLFLNSVHQVALYNNEAYIYIYFFFFLLLFFFNLFVCFCCLFICFNIYYIITLFILIFISLFYLFEY